MNWFQQNRWLGTFLIVFGVCFLVAGYFLFSTKSTFDESFTRFNDAATERSRLERLDPFPSETNYKKMKVYVDDKSVHAILAADPPDYIAWVERGLMDIAAGRRRLELPSKQVFPDVDRRGDFRVMPCVAL